MTASSSTPAAPARPAGAPVPTPSQTVGPYLSIGITPLDRSEVVAPGTPGAVTIGGQVLDGAGRPVPDAVVELWQADPDGRFVGAADGDGFPQWFGRSSTDGEGRYRFVTVKPGTVRLQSGAPQAPHLDLLVFARGLLRPVRTRAYFPDEEAANETDPVLAGVPAERRRTLVAVAEGDGCRFDVHLQGPDETVFFAC